MPQYPVLLGEMGAFRLSDVCFKASDNPATDEIDDGNEQWKGEYGLKSRLPALRLLNLPDDKLRSVEGRSVASLALVIVHLDVVGCL